jgi:hypothetical protein
MLLLNRERKRRMKKKEKNTIQYNAITWNLREHNNVIAPIGTTLSYNWEIHHRPPQEEGPQCPLAPTQSTFIYLNIYTTTTTTLAGAFFLFFLSQ